MKRREPRNHLARGEQRAHLEPIPPLPVPYLRQPDPYSCGPTALAMMLRYAGIDASPRALAEALNVQHDDGPFGGVQEKDLVATAQAFNVAVHAQEDGTIADVVRFLRQRVPVMIGYLAREPGGDLNGHFAVTVGATADAFVIHDPWSKPNTPLPISYLESHWTAESGKVNRWLMAVAKK